MTEIQPQKKNFPILTFLILATFITVIFVSLTISYNMHHPDPDQIDIKSYERVKSSLMNGNKLRMVINFAKMNLYLNGAKESSPDVITSIEINEFEHINEMSSIASSRTKLDNSNGQIVYNTVKVRISKNENVEIEISDIDVSNLKLISKQFYNSTLTSGAIDFFNQTPYHKKNYDNLGNKKKSFFDKYFY